MSGIKQKLKDAFAVDSSSPLEPSDMQRQIVDRVAAQIARRRLTTPALLFLEMSRPLNYIGANVLHFFQPIISAILDTTEYQAFAEFLEHRGSIDYLCRRIEHHEQEHEKNKGH